MSIGWHPIHGSGFIRERVMEYKDSDFETETGKDLALPL